MKLKKAFCIFLSVSLASALCACRNSSKDAANIKPGQTEYISSNNGAEEDGSHLTDGYNQDMEALRFHPEIWNYDSGHDVYWQLGVTYCAQPEALEYETMGIYVPGAYLVGKENGDGTYTCSVNPEGTVKGYTANTAPIVFPVNTAGYSAQAAPSSYDYQSISAYLDAGFVYVYAGMRGRNNGYDDAGSLIYNGGAPWGVTDLKAAVRYYRLNKELLPGSTDRIFTFGHSGGGAQSSLMGASGDSGLYDEYLKSIGAAMYDKDQNAVSDAICGAMCWCPITSLDYANEAYEWNMGQFSSEGTRAEDTWTSELSEDLAEAYASYINELGLKDEAGNLLRLEQTEDGIWTSGSYYEYLLSVVEESLNNFLSDTEFPYTKNSGKMMADGGFGGAGGPGNQTERPAFAENERMGAKQGERTLRKPSEKNAKDQEETTYETVQDYLNALNKEEEWVVYDMTSNTASVKSMEAFVKYCKKAAKAVGAFDDLDRTQAENFLFGNDKEDALHFDQVMADILEKNKEKYSAFADWKETIPSSYAEDLEEVDKFGNSSQMRQNMYNPMYFVSDFYEGNHTSKVAPYWRIHTGIEQGDTALTVETNLALALKECESVKEVDFETVWGQGHTTAERTGNSTDNFIEWVNSCAAR